MARFLTPSKIGLLALIELYTEAVVPTTSTIPVLSFVLSQLLPPTLSYSQHKIGISSFPLDLDAFKNLLSQDAASGMPGRSLYDHFLKKLWKIDSLDALHDFFARRRHLLAKTKEELKRDGEMGIPPPSDDMILLSRTSPFGSFVRRSSIEFERLRFQDSMQLWSSFVAWRLPTKVYWARKSLGMGRWAGDRALGEGEMQWGSEATEMLQLIAYGSNGNEKPEGTVSTDDAERLLEFQVEQMQKLGNRIPVEVKVKFKSLLDEAVLTPSLSHYLNFLDSWRAGDYPSSFDNLHRYFDYTMQNRDRLFYQYALMNLAVLQADFECYNEAVAAMMETVSTARENKDMACLNFALNWLYHFGKNHPKIMKEAETTNMLGVEKEGLAFLRVKAKESGMWTLWSSSLLSEAKLGMTNGESIAGAFENILKSSQLITEKGMKSMMGPQMSMYAALWGRLGITQLSKQYGEIFLRCHARYALFDDTLRFTCRLAHYLTEKGHYAEAIERMDSLDKNSLRSWKPNQYWLRYRGILQLKRELLRNDLNCAERLLSQLLQSNNSDTDPELAFEISLLHIDYLIRRTDFSSALTKIESIASTMRDEGDDLNLRVKLLTVKANLQSRSGRPAKGMSIAVRAASIAWRARLLPALWAAMGAIANILNSLSEFEASAQILTAILPRALECELCSLSAQLYSFLVDAHVGMAEDPAARTKYLTSGSEYADRAFAEYDAIEDIVGMREMMTKKAWLMWIMGERVLANTYAAQALLIGEEGATA